MNKLSKIVIFFSIVSLNSCDKIDKQIIDSNNGKNELTILRNENGKYIVNGKYKSDEAPSSDYIKADIFYEWHSGLAKWTDNRLEIYSQYGNFDTLNANGMIKVIEVSTGEFEKLKKDTIRYTYFYY